MNRDNDFNDSFDLDDDFVIEDAEEDTVEPEDSFEEPEDMEDTFEESEDSLEEPEEPEDSLEEPEEPNDFEEPEDEDFTVNTEDFDEYTDDDFEDIDMRANETDDDVDIDEKPERKLSKAGIIGFIFLGIVIVFAVWALGTNSGRSFCMGIVAHFVSDNMGTDDDQEEDVPDIIIPEDEAEGGTLEIDEKGNVIIRDVQGNIIEAEKEPRREDYVKTYLIFGIEQIDGASNTDAMILVSINSKDSTIKLTSILRDTYVQIPGWDKNKLNSAYAKGASGATTGAEARRNGAALLIRTLEDTFDVGIDGYASVNFSSFEKIINRLGGIDIELGEKEAAYLNKTNYISDPANRNVVPGWNHLNGNQAMGYVRVRKVETLGGTNNDYGRAVRQRRVINAIIKQYKSSKLIDLLSITKDCLGYVNTNLTEEQIQQTLTMIVNNGIFSTKSLRIPVEGAYYDSGEKGIDNGKKMVTYTLVMDGHVDENIKKLHQFIFLDEESDGDVTEDANGAE